MKVNDLLNSDYVLLTEETTKENEFVGFYAGDLLSNTLRSAMPGNVFITVLANQNCVAVALMIDLPAVIICEGKLVPQEMILKANEEAIALIQTEKKAVEVIKDMVSRNFV